MERYRLSRTQGNTCYIEEALDVHHLNHVAKKQPGDKVVACDEKTSMIIEITACHQRHIEGKHQGFSPRRSGWSRTLFGLAKIESKAYQALHVQLMAMGADLIIPLTSDQTRVFDNEASLENEVESALSLTRLPLSSLRKTHILVLGRHPQSTPIHDALKLTRAGDDLLVLVGPESGWSSTEMKRFEEAKSVCFVSLGDRVFRADTAALLSMGAIHAYRQSEVLG
ncbi:MAG: hypothetical protein EA374_01905 [Acholeplasmatales bacterium]|nr:MAG: hypothetical protein EA374_01905 [Acholeplasmatales bacterium]